MKCKTLFYLKNMASRNLVFLVFGLINALLGPQNIILT